MKALIFLTSLLIATNSFAEEGVQISQTQVDDVSVAPAAWNLNLGMSQFQQGQEHGGRGLAVEVQRRLGRFLYLGVSYANYTIERNNPYYSNSIVRAAVDVSTFSAELRPIRMNYKQIEFFAAINGGMLNTSQVATEDSQQNLYYGAGVGVNYNNQIGLRADMKSSRDLHLISALSLVGYY